MTFLWFTLGTLFGWWACMGMTIWLLRHKRQHPLDWREAEWEKWRALGVGR